MAENSAISWTDHTFNPWIGCTKISPGCDHCYAERDNGRRKWVSGWGSGVPRKRTTAANWNKVRRWNHEASAFRTEHGHWPRIFCASLADVFDNEVDPAWRADLFDLIRETTDLRWMLLTKRIGNAAKMLPEDWSGGWPHVGLMASVVNQEEADRDVPKLLATPAAWRGLSCEPLLGPIDLKAIWGERRVYRGDNTSGFIDHQPCIDWVICGGESGPAMRPMHPDWPRVLRDQCADAGVPFHFKQWGEWFPRDQWEHNPALVLPDDSDAYHNNERTRVFGDGLNGFVPCHRVGKARAGRLLDGVEHNCFPEALL